MNFLRQSGASGDANAQNRSAADVADAEVADVGPEHEQPNVPQAPAARPPLRRKQSQPPPPNPQTGPANPQQQAPADSLSLAQLRRIITEFPRADPVAYAFEYTDIGPTEEEIDEWFSYNFWLWVRLNAAQRAFDGQWEVDFAEDEGSNQTDAHAASRGPGKAREVRTWDEADLLERSKFVQDALEGIRSSDTPTRSSAIGRVLYLALGRWGDTAGMVPFVNPIPTGGSGEHRARVKTFATVSQLQAIKAGVELLAALGGVPIIWDALRNAFEPFWVEEPSQAQGTSQEAQDELLNLMTIMYMIIQQTLSDRAEMASIASEILKLNPSPVEYFMTVTSKLRWDETNVLPQAQVFLLFWKSILLVFGGSQELDEVKQAVREKTGEDRKADTITASPLDYHVFRQEITSKYPAYVPPQPVLPLEAENNSILPPLPNNHHPSKNNGILPAPPNAQNGGASILHQPVHIATPAPSPPPSPAVGGKGAKKQNYQTNPNFPFMYPPLDASSNSAGGKGPAGLQNILVGRKWEGSDIPASILEAGELFSQRVRMTRATRQLWEEREEFLKFERGWDANQDDDIEDLLDLSSLSLSEREELDQLKGKDSKMGHSTPTAEIDYGPGGVVVDEAVKRRLKAVEKFYKHALPHLQSLVIVLLKAVLANVTALVTQAQNAQQQANMSGGPNSARPNGGQYSQVPRGPDGSMTGATNESPEVTAEEIDAVRTREITAKAVTGILLMLLKWLKVSHVLKFEYLTQLLVDSNYLPLVLKLFAHQDMQQVVGSKTDRLDSSFFSFCNFRATGGNEKMLPEVQEEEEESEDDAAPPPIRRQRSPTRPSSSAILDDDEKGDNMAQTRPEVDELGYPVNPLPKEPITDFSRRNFFTYINYLRIMQKICKNKSHRSLLLVTYKSSTILRKSLKVPQQELRLYTLKLFKSQVPYCGRKWRQSNMRVITAVYLHCRPELRDEWLSASDVEADIDTALPLEQALRSLTHWFNVRQYPDIMATGGRAALKEEQDFFLRELDKLDMWAVDNGNGIPAEESVSGYWS